MGVEAGESVGNESTNQAKSSSQGSGFPEFPTKGINRRVAGVSTVGAIGLFLSSRLDFGVSLKDLTAVALPYEEVGHFMPYFVLVLLMHWCLFLCRHIMIRILCHIVLKCISNFLKWPNQIAIWIQFHGDMFNLAKLFNFNDLLCY